MEQQTSRDAPGVASALAHGGPLPSFAKRRFASEGFEFCARRPDHASGLLALFNERQFLACASTRGPLPDENELNCWLDGVVATRRFETVALLNGKPVAFAGLYVHGDLLDHSGSVMLGVSEKAQGRGVGSTLLAILLTTAKIRANLRRVQLTVFTGNTSAIRLYRSFGFQFEGLHRSFSRQGDGYIDAYSMAVIFGDGPRPVVALSADAEHTGARPSKIGDRTRLAESSEASAIPPETNEVAPRSSHNE